MNIAAFIQSRPCIEEMEGFRQALVERGEWTGDDQAAWLKGRDALMSGKVVPHPSSKERAYVYQKGKKAKLKPRKGM